jgi:N-acetylglucosaminyldiphosphoundecaprenol N-acetyl-beta-D-mannosaminyltransferase
VSLPQISLFGMKIHAIDMPTAVDTVLAWCGDVASPCRYVVTPNVDHAVMFQSRGDLREAYTKASLVLADGAPLVAVSRLLRRPLPERVAGSDLVPAVFDHASSAASGPPLRVFLLGAAPGVGERAAREIERRWKNVEVVGTYSPPLGFENDATENDRILSMIDAADVELLLVGLGAPKQELWVARHLDRLQTRVALCIGATIDFLAGEKARSPRWMRRVVLEWLHRLCSEPSRLAKRYVRDAWIFPRLVWREWRTMRT